MVANLSAEPEPVRLETVLDLCQMTPADRFGQLRRFGAAAGGIIDQLDEAYSAFLDSVQRDEDELHAEFSDDTRRRQALRHAARYGELVYELLETVVAPQRRRFLVI